MRVVHVPTGSASVPPRKYDSTTKDIFYLTKYLAQSDCEVSVIDVRAEAALRQGSKAKFYEVWNPPVTDTGFIRHLARILTFALLSTLELRRLIKRDQVNLVHTHSQFPATAILLARKLFGWKVPVMHNSHNHEIVMKASRKNRIKHCLELIALKKSDYIMVDTESARQELNRTFGIELSKVMVRPEGLDIEEIDNFVQSNTPAHKDHENKIVIYPALIVPRKNQLGLIKAIPRILESCPATRFVLPGPIGDSQYFKTLQQEIAASGLTERVEFAGELSRVPDLFTWYLSADVFAFPTYYEMQGATLLEAMAFGLPCVASKIGPVIEMSGSDDPCVLLVDPNNIEDLANAIIKLLTEESICQRLSTEGRKRALKYSWGSIADEMLVAYHKIIGPN